MKLFISSTGRAGSSYVYKTLQGAGLQLGSHEKNLGFDGGVINFGFLEDKYFKLIKNDTLYYKIHLVRDPLKCISSLTTTNKNRGPINRRHNMFNDILKPETNTLRRSMIYYYEVNNYLYSLATFNTVLRLEENLTMFESISKETMLFDYKEFLEQSDRFGKKTNTRKHTSYTWEDLYNCDKGLTEKIINLKKVLGYEN